jgi:hypothetical protein
VFRADLALSAGVLAIDSGRLLELGVRRSVGGAARGGIGSVEGVVAGVLVTGLAVLIVVFAGTVLLP